MPSPSELQVGPVNGVRPSEGPGVGRPPGIVLQLCSACALCERFTPVLGGSCLYGGRQVGC